MRTQQFPTLYALSTSGKVKQWNIELNEKSAQEVELIVSTGYIDGKKISHTTIIDKGKNIGKKNETTPWTQAVLEAQSKWNKKKEREGMTEELPHEVPASKENIHVIRPMLAKKYDPEKAGKQKKGITFPCAVQPKLDGHRTLTYINYKTGVIEMYSRNKVSIQTAPHIIDEIRTVLKKPRKVFPADVFWLDGELYTHEMPFEELSGLIRRKTYEDMTDDEKERALKIHYWIFDMYIPDDPDMTFAQRYALLSKTPFFAKNMKYLQLVETENADNPNAIETYLQKYLKEGMEGIILRNWDGVYAVGQRSNDLQKYKLFQDAEFPITGYHEGKGDELGAIIWECTIPNGLSPRNKGVGKTFSVRPMGTREDRKEWFKKAQKDFQKEYKGKLLTVKFQDWTDDGVPRFPEGVAIRWDL